jgi:GDP-L-fucose synthase
VKIIVTGASGFLGRALCPYLAARGHEVTGLSSADCDLTKPDSLDRIAAGQRYDRVYHLAAWTQAGDFCLYHQGDQWVINQLINTHVLTWWLRQQPQAKLIAIGTSCAYPPDQELREENYMLGEPIESLYAYAMTKRMLLAGLRALQGQYGLRYFYAVPSTLYGPGYHVDGRQMHFIFDLVRKIVRGKELGERVVLWGDGYQRREVIYLRDFISALVALCESTENQVVNLGSGEEYTIRHFAEQICDIVGYPSEYIEYDPARYVGARSKCLSITKLRSLLPEFVPTALRRGLEATIQWFYDSKAYLAPAERGGAS